MKLGDARAHYYRQFGATYGKRRASALTRRLILLILRMEYAWKRLAMRLLGEEDLRSLLYDAANADLFASLHWHELLLADAVRVDAYFKAIEQHVGPGDVVVDVGTGIGTLAAFAARKQPKKIYAIDHSTIIDVARKIARKNGAMRIDFVKTSSSYFEPGERVDVILHDQMGRALFDENMVEHLLDLKARLLKPSGRILPALFEFFVEPVCLKDGVRVPYASEHKIHGIDFSCLKDRVEMEKIRSGSYRFQYVAASEVDCLIAKPEPVLRLDLNAIESEEEIPRSFDVERTAIRDCELHGFCVYFNVAFDEDNSFSTRPDERETIWKNTVFRCERTTLYRGDIISYSVCIDPLGNSRRWFVTVNKNTHS